MHTRPRLQQILIAVAACLAMPALAGCGGATATTTAPKTIPAIPFRSAAFTGNTLPTRYTCDGQDISPPLEWGAVPPGVKSLALFISGFRRPKERVFSVEWAVAGLNPSLHKLRAGQLPPGAFLGTRGGKPARYSVCPKKRATMLYEFELFGLPAADKLASNFASLRTLASLVLPQSPDLAKAYGNFYAFYTRK
jgi:phosphatidylethanolamine-binding protein (PEBP) family uncharacterized protein